MQYKLFIFLKSNAVLYIFNYSLEKVICYIIFSLLCKMTWNVFNT